MMKILVLGSAQDAGVPQIGCLCANCKEARKNRAFERFGPSIALLHPRKKFCYIIDASPDIKQQIEIIRNHLTINNNFPITAIFLTHAHYGHCSGLWQLGKECISVKNLPVYCTSKMKSFLATNHPFHHLIDDKNIQINDFLIDEELDFEGFSIKSFEVPHRNEFADTVGYKIKSDKTLIYLPDIDDWNDQILEIISEADFALIDGTFYSSTELPRSIVVPHPPIDRSIELMKDFDTKIYFTHLNHTNKILIRNGKEKKEIIKKGFKIASDGLVLEI